MCSFAPKGGYLKVFLLKVKLPKGLSTIKKEAKYFAPGQQERVLTASQGTKLHLSKAQQAGLSGELLTR